MHQCASLYTDKEDIVLLENQIHGVHMYLSLDIDHSGIYNIVVHLSVHSFHRASWYM